MANVCQTGCLVSRYILVGLIVHTMYKTQIPSAHKLISGLIVVFQPWILWAIKFMSIQVNFDVNQTLLLVSGIYMGTVLIRDSIDALINKANFDVEEILSKYREEGSR